MRFVFVKGKHNFFHYLVVILKRILYLILFGPISFYLLVFGLIFFKQTIEPFPPSSLLEKIIACLSHYPLVSEIKLFIISLKPFYQEAPTWWATTVGLPLITTGLISLFINFINFLESIFNYHYNQGQCPFCKQPVEIRNGKAWKA